MVKIKHRALATKLIAVAEARKDAVAFISPHRGAILTDTAADEDGTTALVKSVDDATNNVIDFFDPITSSSYAVFDSGYKYMYDRFNDVFRYVPLNGDIAGTCARNDINNFPWFSPAGTSRGTILNAVKLTYNPGKAQRDRFILLESIQSSSHQDLESFYLVIRPDLPRHRHLIVSMSVVSLSSLKMLLLLQQKTNSLNSMTKLQEQIL